MIDRPDIQCRIFQEEHSKLVLLKKNKDSTKCHVKLLNSLNNDRYVSKTNTFC